MDAGACCFLQMGDPQIKEKMDLDVDVARLKVLKARMRRLQVRLGVKVTGLRSLSSKEHVGCNSHTCYKLKTQ